MFWGSAYGYRPLAAALATAADRGVLVPDFRLAPEHPFPAALDDALAAAAAFKRHEYRRFPLVVWD